MLHAPRPVRLDRAERVQVAEQVEGDLLVTVGQGARLVDEGVEHHALDVGTRRRDHVVLHAGQQPRGSSRSRRRRRA